MLIVVGASVLGATLAGCSALSDIVAGQVGEAACVVGSGAVDQIAKDVTSAIGNIAIDPVAALTKLSTAQVALGAASVGITTEPAITTVKKAKETLGKLVALAEDASTGAPVDQSALTSLQGQFATDLKDLTGVC